MDEITIWNLRIRRELHHPNPEGLDDDEWLDMVHFLKPLYKEEE